MSEFGIIYILTIKWNTNKIGCIVIQLAGNSVEGFHILNNLPSFPLNTPTELDGRLLISNLHSPLNIILHFLLNYYYYQGLLLVRCKINENH